jgi:hypothetical protein
MRTIRRRMKLTVVAGGNSTRLDADWLWHPELHPEVRLVIHTGGSNPTNVWALSREQLAAGLDANVGEGDVHIRQHWGDDTVREVVLSSPDGTCALLVKRSALAAYLAATTAQDVDEALAGLFRERRS